eukprot:5076315-Amphidinium_carterae.1
MTIVAAMLGMHGLGGHGIQTSIIIVFSGNFSPKNIVWVTIYTYHLGMPAQEMPSSSRPLVVNSFHGCNRGRLLFVEF